MKITQSIHANWQNHSQFLSLVLLIFWQNYYVTVLSLVTVQYQFKHDFPYLIQLWFSKWFVSINTGLGLVLDDASFNACNVFLYVKMQIGASKVLFSGKFLNQTLATFFGDSAEKRISDQSNMSLKIIYCNKMIFKLVHYISCKYMILN